MLTTIKRNPKYVSRCYICGQFKKWPYPHPPPWTPDFHAECQRRADRDEWETDYYPRSYGGLL